MEVEPSVHVCSLNSCLFQTHCQKGPSTGYVTLQLSPTLRSLPLKFMQFAPGISSCPCFSSGSPLHALSSTTSPSLPYGCRPKASGQPLQPGPFTALINSLAARIPRSSPGRAGLLPKEVALPGPSGGDAPSTLSLGLLPTPSPFPLSFGEHETISSYH